MSMKMKQQILWGALVLGIALTASAVSPLLSVQGKEILPFPEDPLKGSRLFVSKGCIKCHAIWGIGDTLGPDLAQLSREKNLLQLAGLLWSHSPKMLEIMRQRGIPRPTFTPQEMGDLMGYIYYFNYFDQPGNFIEGENLFSEKGCIRCHFLGGQGGQNKISLDAYGRYISPSFLVAGLWNHSAQILLEMKKIGLKQPEFKGRELTHLMAYLRGAAVNQNGEAIYAEPGRPKIGKELFVQKKCSLCHSVWGEGGKASTDLGRRELRLNLTEIAGTIWSYSGTMLQEMIKINIPFPTFSPQEMADLISYLYFIQFYDERGDAKKGKKLYREKECIYCHVAEGEGENIGPDLSEGDVMFSPITLASAMWNHAIVMEDMLEEKKLSWPRFSGNEMRDLLSYIQEAAKAGRQAKAQKRPLPSKNTVVALSKNTFDLELAGQGEKIYRDKACLACHNFEENSRLMGGGLKNITKKRDLEWLFNFIKDPKSVLKTDVLAKQLLREFNGMPMPNQGLSDSEVVAIIEYLKAPEKVKS
jgi:cytochrome c2